MRAWRTSFASALVCAALLTAGFEAFAQSASVVELPDDCRGRRDTKPVLDRRKAEIEARIQTMRAALADVPSEEPRARQMTRDLRRLQEDLLEVIFAADCLRLPPPKPALERMARPMAAQPPPPPPTNRSLQAPAPATPPSVRQAAPAPQAVEVTAYYATNRVRATAPATAADTYSNDGIGDLTFGRTVVSIPLSHTAGNIELPQLWKFERTPDPNRHFVLKSVAPLPTDAARQEMSQRLRAMSSKSMLVFVHGYNVSFQDAAMRSAQLAHDLKFPGVPFFYSWPSANRVRAYLQDEETARLCESVFETVLTELSKLPVEEIYIVAHSMGNRVVGHGLQAYVDKGKNTKVIKELLLAAPDINADLFKSTIAPRLAQMQGTRTTIYASSFDLALVASKVVHGFRRVGESSGGVQVFSGMDTVDASNASQSIRNFGHSYIVDSASVIGDLRAIVAERRAAKARGLTQMGAVPDIYWQLPTSP